jgi:hypothetical protein
LTKFLEEPEFVTQMLAALYRYRQPIGMSWRRAPITEIL